MGYLRELYKEENCASCDESFPLKALYESHDNNFVCKECHEYLNKKHGNRSVYLDDMLRAEGCIE